MRQPENPTLISVLNAAQPMPTRPVKEKDLATALQEVIDAGKPMPDVRFACAGYIH
jgi:hypothetical protein